MIKVHHGGMVFEAENAAEAAELYRQLKGDGIGSTVLASPKIHTLTTPKHSKRPAKKVVQRTFAEFSAAHNAAPQFSEWVPSSALGFLTSIRQASPGSPSPERIMQAVGTDSAKGFGGRTAQVNRLLAHLGYDQDTVYLSRRDGKTRYWYVGPRIDDAIRSIRQKFPAVNNAT